MHESVDEHQLERILQNNEDLALHNREHFDELGVLAVNLMSAPGAGKTTLLEKTLTSLTNDWRCSVIEGDMVRELDADRLRKNGVDVTQISTGRSCHLDAQMVARVLHAKAFSGVDFLFIENVGNLVCPAEFPLGEHRRVVLLSVTEGDDKPIKYPVIFHRCDAVIFTKCDLLPYVKFDIERATKHLKNLNPLVHCFSISAMTGQGMDEWIAWLSREFSENKANSPLVTHHR